MLSSISDYLSAGVSPGWWGLAAEAVKHSRCTSNILVSGNFAGCMIFALHLRDQMPPVGINLPNSTGNGWWNRIVGARNRIVRTSFQTCDEGASETMDFRRNVNSERKVLPRIVPVVGQASLK